MEFERKKFEKREFQEKFEESEEQI